MPKHSPCSTRHYDPCQVPLAPGPVPEAFGQWLGVLGRRSTEHGGVEVVAQKIPMRADTHSR